MTYIHPEKCETCGAKCIERTISSRWTSPGTETTSYKCGMRYESYINHGFRACFDVKEPCPKSSEELKKAVRREEIDAAVANALNKVKASHEEAEAFCKRMERDKGWSMRADEGVWSMLRAKRPRND